MRIPDTEPDIYLKQIEEAIGAIKAVRLHLI